MVKFLIHKPVAVIVVFVALMLLGILAIKKIPISSLPDIDIPEITVHVNNRNFSAYELENTVIKRLQALLFQVPDIADIHTETKDGYSIIRLRFNYGSDINHAFLEVNEKIDLSMNSLPRDMERPIVIKSSITDLPVFYINLRLKKNDAFKDASFRFIELSNFAEKVIKRRLEQLPEIAFVDITGMVHSEVCIIPDKAIMQALNFKDDDFKRIIESNNLILGNVRATDSDLQYNIRFSSANISSVEDIRNIPFILRGRIFKLKDIAKIEIRSQEPSGAFIAHNEPALSLAVIKQPASRMEDLHENVKKLLEKLEKTYPDIQFEQTQDQTELLDYSISNLKQDLLAGKFFCFYTHVFLFEKFTESYFNWYIYSRFADTKYTVF